MIYNALFIATGYSAYGLITQIFRSMVIRIPVVYLLSSYVSLNMIWCFQPIAFLGATILTALFAWVLMRKINSDFRMPGRLA